MTGRIIWTAEKKAHFRKLWLAGVMVNTIAKELGVSPTGVKKMRRAMDLPKRRHDAGPAPCEINVRFSGASMRLMRGYAEKNGYTLAFLIRKAITEFIGQEINK